MTGVELVIGILGGVLVLMGLKEILIYFFDREDRDDV